MKNSEEREANGVEILNIRMGLLGEQHVAIFSYRLDAGKPIEAYIANIDMTTCRYVPAHDVIAYHIRKGEVIAGDIPDESVETKH